MEASVVIEKTRQWVEKIVIGLNVCPFAAPVVRTGRLKLVVSAADTAEQLMQDLLAEFQFLLETPSAETDTTLLIHPYVLRDFEAYLDFVAEAEDIMDESDISQEFQLATFHPDYIFEDEVQGDPASYTNRSPFQMIHILREASLSEVIDNHPDTDLIPAENVRKFREMGIDKILDLLDNY